MKLFYIFMIIFALFLIPNSIFAVNHDSPDMLLSEMPVDEFKSFTETQLIELSKSIKVNPVEQAIVSLLFIGIGAGAAVVGSLFLNKTRDDKITNKIKTLISLDFNSLSSELISRLEHLEAAKKTLNEKIANETNQQDIPDVNLKEIIDARELKLEPHYYQILHDTGELLKLSADEIAKVPPVMVKIIQLNAICKGEAQTISHGWDGRVTTFNYFVLGKYVKKITELIEAIKEMKTSCESLKSNFKWLKE